MDTPTRITVAADLAAREITNGVWLFINLSCLIVFLMYSWKRSMKKRAWSDVARMIRERDFEPDTQASIAMTMYFIGATIRAGYVWWLLKAQSKGWVHAQYVEEMYWVMHLAAAFAIIGGLCVLRVFTRLEWGHRAWIAAAIISLLVPFVIHYL
jgi:hypothetical protein